MAEPAKKKRMTIEQFRKLVDIDPTNYAKYWPDVWSGIYCCQNPKCLGHTFRPATPPKCICGRFCGTCGRFKYVLLPKLPEPPKGVMKTFDDIKKLNWIEYEGNDVALIPPSFWNLWKNKLIKMEIEAADLRIKKHGSNWLIYKKHITYLEIHKQ